MIFHIKAILDRLGLDLGGSWGRLCASWGPSWLQLGVQDRSRAALERPRAVQDSPRAAQECPRQPRTAQEPPKSFPKADQDGQELPRTRPGLVQDLPRSATEPTHYPRLEKNSQLHPAILQNFLSKAQSGQLQKRAAAVLPPRGSSIRQTTLVSHGRAQDRGLVLLLRSSGFLEAFSWAIGEITVRATADFGAHVHRPKN